MLKATHIKKKPQDQNHQKTKPPPKNPGIQNISSFFFLFYVLLSSKSERIFHVHH